MNAFLTSIVLLIAITAVAVVGLRAVDMSAQSVYQSKPDVRL